MLALTKGTSRLTRWPVCFIEAKWDVMYRQGSLHRAQVTLSHLPANDTDTCALHDDITILSLLTRSTVVFSVQHAVIAGVTPSGWVTQGDCTKVLVGYSHPAGPELSNLGPDEDARYTNRTMVSTSVLNDLIH